MLIYNAGQNETFNWAASGSIITAALTVTLSTLIVIVGDPHPSTNTFTFMSNILYACSIMYPTILPMVLVFNKAAVTDCRYGTGCMRDFDEFDTTPNDGNILKTPARSICRVRNPLYYHIPQSPSPPSPKRAGPSSSAPFATPQ